ncbi:MAG: diguanylate cyclase [Magnetococcus sp. YQC-5]
MPVITFKFAVLLFLLYGTGIFLWRTLRNRALLKTASYWVVTGWLLLIMDGLTDILKTLNIETWHTDAGYWIGIPLLAVGLWHDLPKTMNGDEMNQIIEKLVNKFVQKEIQRQNLEEVIEENNAISKLANDAIISFDSNGIITYWNQGAEKMFGYPERSILGSPMQHLIHPKDRNQYDLEWQVIDTSTQSSLVAKPREVLGVKNNGESLPMELTLATWTMKQSRYFVAVIRDITHRKEQEQLSKRIAESRFAISEILELSLEPMDIEEFLMKALQAILAVPWVQIEAKGCIFLTDPHTKELVMTAQVNLSKFLLAKCARVQPGYCLCGRAAESMEVVFSNELDHRHDVLFEGISQHGHYCIPIIYQENLYGLLNLYVPHMHTPDADEISFLTAIANTLAGVVERKKIENRLKQLADHDELTGLPNRRQILRRLHQDLALAIRENRTMVIMMMDLDHFKQVNDIQGHQAGDALLVEVAQRMKKILRISDTVGRLGGDEFIALLPIIRHADDVSIVADKLINTVSKPYMIHGQECRIGISIGISIYPLHGAEVDLLLQRADIALYAIKENGRNGYQIFSEEMV